MRRTAKPEPNVRKITSRRHAMNYVSKYAAKECIGRLCGGVGGGVMSLAIWTSRLRLKSICQWMNGYCSNASFAVG